MVIWLAVTVARADRWRSAATRHQWRTVFAMIKKQVMKLTPTISVRISATLSAS